MIIIKEHNPSYDEKGFPLDRDGSPTPVFLQGVIGSLAEERQSQPNFRKRNELRYNKERGRFLKNLSRSGQPSLFNLINQPDDIVARLASLRSSYPMISFDLNVNVGTIIKQKTSLIRSFLIWYLSLKQVPEWIDWMICQEFDRLLLPEKLVEGKILNTGNVEYLRKHPEEEEISKSSKIRITYKSRKYREALSLYSLYQVLGREETWNLITEIYSKNTIKNWIQVGESLARSHCVVTVPRYALKEKVRRRGYAHSSNNPNSLRSQKGRLLRMINKDPETQELEDTITRIKLKQAQLFEKRLDAILAIQSEVPKEIKKEYFHQMIKETIPVIEEDNSKIIIKS